MADLYPGTLIEGIRRREVTPFVGAGLSIASGGLSWSALCRRIIAEGRFQLGHERWVVEVRDALSTAGRSDLGDQVESTTLNGYDPLMITQMYRDRFDRVSLIRLLREMCAKLRGPTAAHRILVELGFRVMVTTNYDDLIEQAYRAAGHDCHAIVREEDAAYWGLGDARVIKMHGSLINPFDPDSVVIAREDYEAYADRRPNMDIMVRFLMTTGTLMLVGYSGRDPNFLALHDRVRLALKKNKARVFFVTFDMPPAMQEYWTSYGFYPISLTGVDRQATLEGWLTELRARV